MTSYQPKTGAACSCRRGQQRDNCPECEGTGWRIDFAAIRANTQAVTTANKEWIKDAQYVNSKHGA